MLSGNMNRSHDRFHSRAGSARVDSSNQSTRVSFLREVWNERNNRAIYRIGFFKGRRRRLLSVRYHLTSGFTLIEILVVLAIVGLMTGIALPRLTALYVSVENSSQRRLIQDQIEGLGYLAYARGKSILLETTDTSRSPSNENPIQLPPGWRIDVLKPLRYSSQGICEGGKLTISDPAGGKAAFRLAPPICRLEATAGNEG